MSVVSCQLSVVRKKSVPRTTDHGPRTNSPRSGLSLTEVLIAMGILTIGLLSVAAVFPVGSFYMQKAEIADRGSAIAQSVMNDLVSRGMLNPRAWYTLVPYPSSAVVGDSNYTFPSDGQSSPNRSYRAGYFTRPVATALGEGLATQTSTPAAAVSVVADKSVISRQFGNAYVIDPLGVSRMAFFPPSNPSQATYVGPGSVFPGS